MLLEYTHKNTFLKYSMLNSEVFKNVHHAGKRILVVTKYWDTEKTKAILASCEKKYPEIFLALGENRIEKIQEKNLPREKVHFIGNIQSRKIPEIVKYSSTIHSLASLKHAQQIDKQWLPIQAFIQIKLDEHKDIWITESQLPGFLESCKIFKNLKIIGLAGMWVWEFSEQEKRDEFYKLISLRNTYLPKGYISAGTSRDYEIALEAWIDIVRVGSLTIS